MFLRAADLIQSIANEADDGSAAFISQNLGILKKYRSQQKLKKELKELKHIKCKFLGCQFSAINLEEFMGHILNCVQQPQAVSLDNQIETT